MPFKKTLVQRLFNLSRFSTPRNTVKKPPEPSKIKRNPQRRPLYQSAITPSLKLFPHNLSETLNSINITNDRIQLNGLVARDANAPQEVGLSVSDVRKVLRASQTELIKGKLTEVEKDWVSYEEFMKVIEESCGGNKNEALTFAKTLDECGSVIVVGNVVCLRPHQVAKTIQGLVSPPLVDPNDPRREELELLEEQMAEIDKKAEALVRRELWAGLGYMMVQTAAFMRLTFWELSWDVMEPICFYVTSGYFMLGYGFFLKTSVEPSFEGFYLSRFNAKQKRLLKTFNFDIKRYNELKKIFHQKNLSTSLEHSSVIKLNHYKID